MSAQPAMSTVCKRAYARAGLVGNPSDGYHGKTLSLEVRDYWAEVTLCPSDHVEIVLSQEDRNEFRSVHDLAADVRLHGYYGGIRLVKATIKKFADYCDRKGIPLHDRPFSVGYRSTIPRQVGLAGSSAIIVATLRCLMEFYGVDIPQRVQPSLALSVETEELGIAAGLQDRVVQVYGGLVWMDFAEDKMKTIDGLECGVYEPMDPELLPPMYLAHNGDASEPTEVVHNNLRERFATGDRVVEIAMRTLALNAAVARERLLGGNVDMFGRSVDRNFDLRTTMCRIAPAHLAMVAAARSAGATASFAGSGGAIVGTYPDEATFQRLQDALGLLHCETIRIGGTNARRP